MTRPHELFERSRIEPDPDRGRRAVSRELRLQSGRGSGRGRDRPPRPRRGPARDLAAARRPQRRRRRRTGASIRSRSCDSDVGPAPEEIWGCEDPRLTWLPERDEWAIAYTAYSRRGPLVSLAMTPDFRTVRRLGPVMPPEDKDAALFPRRFDGRWAMIHRPSPLRGGAHMWISYSPDLRHWGDHRLLLEARDGAWWDAGKIGLGPPPLETPEGWLVLYHGVHATADGPIYRVGLALLDLDDPGTILHRTDEWVFGPVGVVRDHRRRRPGRVPVRLDARRGGRPPAHLLRRRRQRDRARDGSLQRGPPTRVCDAPREGEGSTRRSGALTQANSEGRRLCRHPSDEVGPRDVSPSGARTRATDARSFVVTRLPPPHGPPATRRQRHDASSMSAQVKRARFAFTGLLLLEEGPTPAGSAAGRSRVGDPWLCVPASRRVCPGRSSERETGVPDADGAEPAGPTYPDPTVPVAAGRTGELPAGNLSRVSSRPCAGPICGPSTLRAAPSASRPRSPRSRRCRSARRPR